MAAAQRSIIVHDRAHAEAAAIAAARLGVPVALRSPPGGSPYLGPSVFRAMVEAAREAAPAAQVAAVMDCGGDAGHALAALRHGIERVRVDLPAATVARLANIARHYGAVVDTCQSSPLDLLDCVDAAAKCKKWLASGEK